MNQNHLGKLFFLHILFYQYFLFRTRLLSDVYSLLADLIDWSDKLLLLKSNDKNIQINHDDKYQKIAHDLIQAIKVRTNSIGIEICFRKTFYLELYFVCM